VSQRKDGRGFEIIATVALRSAEQITPVLFSDVAWHPLDVAI
jgi:hypothetical protein